MRLLHTSDWHLGRSFLGVDMLGAQATFMDHLLEVIEAERVDVVLVSGDIYDRALPPTGAVELFSSTLERIADSRARAVLTSGNHDSHLRLGFASSLIDRAGVHLRTHPRQVGTPILIDDQHGTVAIHPIPFLEPDQLRVPWELSARSHEAALREATNRIRADLAGRRGTRSVVLAHAFVAGAEPSESERDISVGGVQLVPTSLFDDFDYVALGHLHGRHTLTDRLRYSGSPLAYSFSEAAHTKGSWLVDLDSTGFAAATFVAAPVPRALSRITGRIDDILTARRFTPMEDHWVQVVVTDPVRPTQAKPRLERRFPHLLSLAFAPEGGSRSPLPQAPSGARLSDHDIALAFVSATRGEPATDAEALLLRDAVESCCDDRERDRRVRA